MAARSQLQTSGFGMYEIADYGLLGARLCLTGVFLYSGIDKALNWSDGLDEVRALGLPWPKLCLLSTIAVQVGAGLMVLLGIFPRLGAFLLFGFTAAATLAAHRFRTEPGAALRSVLTVCLEHLAIMGGFVLVMVAGAGRIALGG